MSLLSGELREAATEHEAAEALRQSGLTDGLPVIVPTPVRMERIHLGTSLAPVILLGEIAPRCVAGTVEAAAVNAVMAGCLPEHLPLVIAAVEGIAAPEFSLSGVQATTHNCTLLLIVNGPGRQDNGPVASVACALGPGHRANVAIGRVVRLVMIDIGHVRPGFGDMAQLRHPGKFSYCIAEYEESSPFEPFHVSRGFDRDETVVSVLAGEAPHSARLCVQSEEDVERLLTVLGMSLATIGSNNVQFGTGSVAVVLDPEHANSMAGLGKSGVQEGIFHNTWLPTSLLVELHGETIPVRCELLRRPRANQQPCCGRGRRRRLLCGDTDVGRQRARIRRRIKTYPRGHRMHYSPDHLVAGWAPLSGVRVLDLTALLPGPFASQILADLGATVVKVERPPGGDALRELQPAMFDAVNRGKSSIVLDLKSSDDRDTLLALTREADVVMEGFRPGVLDRLGVGFDVMRIIHPSIVFLSLSGWGQSGPLVDDPGHNGSFLARTGATALTRDSQGFPVETPIPVADLSAALYAVIAILAALRAEPRKAVHLDVSLFASGLAFMVPRLAESLSHEGDESIMTRPANGVFPCDDGHVLIAAVEDHYWTRLCETLDLRELSEDAALSRYRGRTTHAVRINELIAARTSLSSRNELVAKLRAQGLPVAPVLDVEEVASDPQVRALDLISAENGIRSFLPVGGVSVIRDGEKTLLDERGSSIRAKGWQGA